MVRLRFEKDEFGGSIWAIAIEHKTVPIYFVARFTPFSKVSQKSVKIVSSKRRLSTPDTPPEISPSHHLILQMCFVEETITKMVGIFTIMYLHLDDFIGK